MILSQCESLKNLTIERGHVMRPEREPIAQADIDALDAMLSPLSQLEALEFKYFGLSPEKNNKHSVSAEDTSLQLPRNAKAKNQLRFPRNLTDRVRSLRSIDIDGDPTEWFWPVFMRCIGTNLRSLTTGAFLEAGDIDQFATACTELERLELRNTPVTLAEISKLIRSCGSRIKHIYVEGLYDEDSLRRLQMPSDAMLPSLMQTLAEHSNSLEVLDLRNEVCVRLADLQVLGSPESCPALRELIMQNIRQSKDESDSTEEHSHSMRQETSVDPRIDAALATIVEYHKDTLEKIRLASGQFGWGDFEVGNTFIRACASLGPQIRETDAKAAQDLDIKLVDDLHRKHPELEPVEKLAGKPKLWKKEWGPRHERLSKISYEKSNRRAAMMG